MSQMCVVCKINNGIYKCPKCRNPYCSVNCCRRHKEIGCEEIASSSKIEETTTNFKDYNYITEDTVPIKELEKLRDCRELKELLRVSDLQKLLTALDKSSNPDKDVQKAMMDPLFSEFADHCLKIVEPSDE